MRYRPKNEHHKVQDYHYYREALTIPVIAAAELTDTKTLARQPLQVNSV